MKKLKFVPLLGLAALLSGCNFIGGGNAEATAPKFATQGDEVSYANFQKEYAKVATKSELYKTDKLGSRVLKGNQSSVNEETVKRDGKEISKTESKYIVKGESSYDTNALVAKTVGEITETDSQSNQNGTYSSKSTYKSETYYQFGVVASKNVLLNVDAKKKEYSVSREVLSSEKEEDIFDTLIKNNLSSFSSYFDSRLPEAESEAKNYKFYINGDVYTYEIERETNSNRTDGTKKVANVSNKLKVKVQIDVTDGKQAVRFSSVETVETSYIEDYYSDDARKGDVSTDKTTYYVDYSVASKDPKLKEVDLSKYYLPTNRY